MFVPTIFQGERIKFSQRAIHHMFEARQDVSSSHVFQEERMFFQRAIYQMFDKKIQGKTLFKSNILYIIEKFLKHDYLKWSFILDFKLKD